MTCFFVVAAPLRTRALLTPPKAKPRSRHQKSPPLKTKGGGAPKGADRAASKSDAARALFSFPPCRRTEATGTSRSGRARLSAPHRGIHRGFSPGSAQAALPGITGCKREDPLRHQCSEHLAVRHAPDGTMPKPPVSAVYRCAPENRSRSASRSTLAKGVLRERDFSYVTAVGTIVKTFVVAAATLRVGFYLILRSARRARLEGCGRGARTVALRGSSLRAGPEARMERSGIRERRRGSNTVPAFRRRSIWATLA
jgi:hypothetical protein